MSFVNQHDIEKVLRRGGYDPIPRTHARNGGNHHVVLTKIFPRFVGTYRALRRKDFRTCKVQRQCFNLLEIYKCAEILSDLLSDEPAWRKNEHALRPHYKG